MENIEFTKQLSSDPLFNQLLEMSIASKVQIHLLMSFMLQKTSNSKDEQMKFFKEFLEFEKKHRKDLTKEIRKDFIDRYMNL